MGIVSFPGTDPLWLGMLGMHGTFYANMAVSHCDLLIAVGVRFDDRVTGTIETFAPTPKLCKLISILLQLIKMWLLTYRLSVKPRLLFKILLSF